MRDRSGEVSLLDDYNTDISVKQAKRVVFGLIL